MAETSPKRILTTDQLPDDPFQMPPPYWRGSGAIFHIEAALADLVALLRDLVPLHADIESRLGDHYEQYPDYDEGNEQALEEFAEICSDLWDHEHQIRLKAELASLMSAIEAEDELNRFCVYNLHRDISESIEKLSPPEKLLIASASVDKPGLKGDSVFEAIRKLSAWRNAFVHGHCVDRPTKSLRHNHLIHPENLPGVLEALATMRELVGAYLRVSDYLCGISLNPYTGTGCSNIEDIRGLLKEISDYHFDGSSYVYDVILGEPSLRTVAGQIESLARSPDEGQRAKLEDLLATLDPNDAKVLRLEFGLDGGRTHSHEEIMALMGLTKQDVARIRSVALTRLASTGLDEPAV
jgi:hypothetical protein